MIFHCYSARSLSLLGDALRHHGFRSYPLQGADVRDDRSFLEAFTRVVPYHVYAPSDLGPTVNWDAFGDCLWGGLKGERDERVAILWLGAEAVVEANLGLLLAVVESLSFEAYKLLGTEHPIILRVYLIGDGPNFPDFPADGDVYGAAGAPVPGT